MFTLTEEQRKQLLQYMWQRPYGEVAQLVAMLASLKSKKNDNATSKNQVGPEAKLHKKLVKATPRIVWNRLENLSNVGCPDLLGYNAFHTFFTVELKVPSRDPQSKSQESFSHVPWFKNLGA